MKKLLFLILLIAITFSCQESKNVAGKFILKDATSIGIDFNNKITDLPRHNALVYETFYSGGGVAIGDVNNDGLQDLYFAGNQVADRLYLNKGDWQFEDVTVPAGIKNNGSWSTGVTMIDINEDGWLDIYVCNSLYDEKPNLRKNQLFINNQNGTFSDQAGSYGLADIWRTQEACFFDFDQDGDNDVLMVNQPPNPGPLSALKGIEYRVPELGPRLLENRNNKFVDVSEEKGIAHSGYAISASVADVNEDGWLDIYLGHDYSSPDKLFLSQEGKTFTNTIDESCDQISFFSMGTDISDLDNNGLNDMVVVDMVASDPYRNKANMGGMNPEAFWSTVKKGGHYQYMYNSMQMNTGIEGGVPHFSNIAQMLKMSNTDWSWAPLIADFDNDGYKDLYITNGIKRDLRFTDGINAIKDTLGKIKRTKKITQEEILEHADPFSLIAQLPSSKLPNYFFRNVNGNELEDVTDSWNLGTPSFSQGAAVGDLDNDGDLDIVVNNTEDYPFIYENALSKGNYLRLKLLADTEDIQAYIGASVKAYIGKQVIASHVATNRGYYSCSEDIVHLGLGQKTQIDSLVVRWNSKERTVISKPSINQELRIVKADQSSRSLKSSSIAQLSDFGNDLNVAYLHDVSTFDDYEKQVLLPHQIGITGAAISVDDFNGDGLSDFVIGSTEGQASVLYKNNGEGFGLVTLGVGREKVATDMVSLDLEGDGDKDIYVACGGNMAKAGDLKYQNYFLVNDGSGSFSMKPDTYSTEYGSDSDVDVIDVNGDGLLDLLISARHKPWQYPESGRSTLLINNSKSNAISFIDQTSNLANDLESIGMVTESSVVDLDKDGDEDIIMVGEWMPITILENLDGSFRKTTIPNSVGWWMTVAETDYNDDGLPDFLVGNLGLNAKYKSGKKNKFSVYFDDFDNNGNSDIVLSYSKGEKEFPVRGRSCSSEQLPMLKSKFPTYHEFASASINDIYGSSLSSAFSVDDFSSSLLKNKGGLQFEMTALPLPLQVSCVQHFQPVGDKYLAVGNLNTMEIETPNVDALKGVLFEINPSGAVHVSNPSVSDKLGGQICSMYEIKNGSRTYLVHIPVGEKIQVLDAEKLK